MRRQFTNVVTGLLILSMVMMINWSARSAFKAVRPTTLKPARTSGDSGSTIDESRVVEIQRFATVEAYFSASNPNPLSHRRGQPLFDRDVSRAKRSAVLLRDGGCLVCGATEQLECDHRIALMNGGDNSFENLGTLCDSCHKEKTRYDWSIQRRRRKDQ